MRARTLAALGLASILNLGTVALPMGARAEAPAPATPTGDTVPTRAVLQRIAQIGDIGRLREQGFLDDPAGLRGLAYRQALVETSGRQDAAAMLEAAARLLAVDPADIDAHLSASRAYQQQGNGVLADVHRRVAGLLLHVIVDGRTGDSPATAFEALAIPEEYAVLGLLGLKASAQALVHVDGHAYDVFDAIDNKQQARKVFFAIDRMIAAETRAVP